MNVFKPLATLGAASVLAFAVQSAQAGPTIEFGDEGFVQINYALQLWSQQRSYTNGNHDGSSFDTFLRRNRITLFGQKMIWSDSTPSWKPEVTVVVVMTSARFTIVMPT